ncbi:MAG: helix-turn-helix transcriptional regulator [Clostridia bacterium]|nr:helix-turn-helix transcriptional regulator [Clostridia bacterium]
MENSAQEKKSMGKRIMSLRKAAGMTQEQLSSLLGVTPQAVSKWENDVSCPDVTMLPHIAEVFGVSTDSLLGREDIDTEAVRAAYAKESSQKAQISKSGMWFGALVVVAGLALLCGQFMDVAIKPWGVIWASILLVLGTIWMLRRFSFLNLGVVLLGLYLLMSNLGVAVPFVLTWATGVPIFLVLLGLTILWDHLFPRPYKEEDWEHWNRNSEFMRRHAESKFSDEDGHVSMKSSFAENNYVTNMPRFNGGEMEVHFGHGVLDMRGLQGVGENAVLHVEISFGCGEVWLPRTLRADLQQVSKSAADYEEHGAYYADAKPVRIMGSVSFGSLEIHYM